MAEQKNKWNWEVSGFDPWKSPTSSSSSSFEQHDQKPPAPLVRRYSISTSSVLPHSEMSKHSMASKLHRLGDKVNVTDSHSISASSSSSSFSSNLLDEFWFSAFSRESFSVYSMLVLLMAMYVFLRRGAFQ